MWTIISADNFSKHQSLILGSLSTPFSGTRDRVAYWKNEKKRDEVRRQLCFDYRWWVYIRKVKQNRFWRKEISLIIPFTEGTLLVQIVFVSSCYVSIKSEVFLTYILKKKRITERLNPLKILKNIIFLKLRRLLRMTEISRNVIKK